MITLYGINNCDSVRKAKRWLQARGLEVRVHDFREQGLSRKQLRGWLASGDIGTLLNRRSAGWRALPENTRKLLERAIAGETAKTDDAVLDVLCSHPTLLKRPLIDRQVAGPLVGFDEQAYQALLAESA